ncbi:MAG TPA: hypothetical protein VK812_20580 [Candidatus Binatus sp.]|jgi:hypothetical protein|nr:hypothetical protein [Candidatus Binatus sp.]
MPAQADIIVSSPDATEVRLVVEAKLRIPNLEATERELKNFMLQLSCPLGLLVSPQRLWVYLDRFTSDSQESVERLGEFNVEGLIRFRSPGGEGPEEHFAFENAVQDWLEGLAATTTQDRVEDPKLLETISHYILPAVESGVIRAAGPR